MKSEMVKIAVPVISPATIEVTAVLMLVQVSCDSMHSVHVNTEKAIL